MGNWPETKSKFKGCCKKCKVEYEAGATIYKINEDYWCSNENCPGIPGNPGEKEPPKAIDLEAKLDQIWDIAYAKASKIVDEKFSKEQLVDHFKREQQKLIMAQTFVKALCGNGD